MKKIENNSPSELSTGYQQFQAKSNPQTLKVVKKKLSTGYQQGKQSRLGFIHEP